MNLEQANALLKALGSTPGGHGDKWVRGSCPLAPWTHKKGKDSNPSFGLYVSPGEPGRFYCFACTGGALSTLLQTIEFHSQKNPGSFHGDLHKARQIIEQEELELAVLPEFSEFGVPEKKFEPLPEWFLNTFLQAPESGRAMAYLEYRGFNEVDAGRFDVRYDPLEDRIVFPYRDVFGRLAGLRGRRVELPGENVYHAKHHDYVWNGINNASLVWLNEEILDEEGPVVVVEGQFDLMRVARVYPRVLGNLTAKPVRAKVKKLAQCEGVILMLDGDFPGRTATQKFLEAFDELKIKCVPVLLPIVDVNGNPIDPKSPEAIKTDPDKIGEKWIREALLNVGVDVP